MSTTALTTQRRVGVAELHPNSAGYRASCTSTGCKRRGARLYVKCDPVSFAAIEKRLCPICARAGSWQIAFLPRSAVLPL